MVESICGMVGPNRGVVEPNRGIVDPLRGMVGLFRGTVEPNRGIVGPNRGIEGSYRGTARLSRFDGEVGRRVREAFRFAGLRQALSGRSRALEGVKGAFMRKKIVKLAVAASLLAGSLG